MHVRGIQATAAGARLFRFPCAPQVVRPNEDLQAPATVPGSNISALGLTTLALDELRSGLQRNPTRRRLDKEEPVTRSWGLGEQAGPSSGADRSSALRISDRRPLRRFPAVCRRLRGSSARLEANGRPRTGYPPRYSWARIVARRNGGSTAPAPSEAQISRLPDRHDPIFAGVARGAVRRFVRFSPIAEHLAQSALARVHARHQFVHLAKPAH